MNKEKIKQLMKEEGYEEISGREYQERKNNLDRRIIILNHISMETLHFKPKEKIDKKIDELERRHWDCKNCRTVNENADVCKNCGDQKEFSEDNNKLQELRQELK